MAADYTRQWIQFFTGCGIPEDIAATYGLIFNENRIQKNMLLDLNKEYLRDMGITVMGDVIAILRHAKVVHDKYVREQILSESEEMAVGNCEISESEVKKRTPVKRILEHYTRKCETSDLGMPPEKVQIQIENENSVMEIPNQLLHHISPRNKVTVKKKIEAPSMVDDLAPIKPVVPMPKVRRVLPENEGSYKIKMPSGTTERSKKILEKAKLKQNKTVFERLGESSVSSTSDVITSSNTTTQILKPSVPKEKNASSVFARLGEKSSLVTSTSSNGDFTVGGKQLPYRGILKSKTVKKLGFLPGSTMRADNELQKSQGKNTKIKKINLKERLGMTTKITHLSPPRDSIKLNRLQITTTFEDEETEPAKVTLSSRFTSIKPPIRDGKSEKLASDCVGTFRSEAVQNISRVTSTTQLPDTKLRGVKRRLESSESAVSEPSDVVQSKKVRFGRTTQRLIPGNPTEIKETTKVHPSLTMMIGNETAGSKKIDKLTLTSGVKIGPMNSDKIRQKLSLKDRIGSGSVLLKSGRMVTDLKRKRSLKFTNRLKPNTVSVHDRLG